MPVGCAPAACQVSIAENFDELKHVFFVLQTWVVIHVATIASEVSTLPLDSAISIGSTIMNASARGFPSSALLGQHACTDNNHLQNVQRYLFNDLANIDLTS